jgi:YVTN family beta-propeller protein
VSLRLPFAAFLLALAVFACSSGDDDTELPSTIPVGSKPWAVAVNEGTGRLYSANEAANSITIVDLATRREITTLSGGSGPNAAAVNRATGRVYIANAFSNDVTVIENDAVIATIPTGESPWDVAVDEAADRVYVANAASGTAGTVSVIDGATNTNIDTISGFTQPWGVIVIDGTLYVADANANAVRKVDVSTGQITAQVSVGERPRGLAYDSSTGRLYVTNTEEESVSVIDLPAFQVVATIPVGLSPLEIAVNPVRQEAYVVNSLDDSLSVIDTAAEDVRASLKVGRQPWDVKVSADGFYIYVASAGTSEIRVLTPDEFTASPGA